MRNCRILALLLAAATLGAIALPGCSESQSGVEQTAELVPLENWQSYVIVRPDTSTESVTNVAVALKKSLAEITGTELDLTTDWVKRGEEVPTGTLEILVGQTNRPESLQGLKYHDCIVAYTDGRVVINGGNSEAVASAVDWFIANCLSAGQISVPVEPYVQTGTYPLADMTVAGVPLSDYTINYTLSLTGSSDYAEGLAAWIAEGTGVYNKPSTKDEGNSIRLMADDSVSFMDVSLKSGGGDLTVTVNPSGVGIADAVTLLIERLAAGTSLDSLDETVSMGGENYHVASDADIAEWRKLTDERIETILASPNMEIPENKVVYYVSPNGNDANDGKSPETAWKTLDKVNSASLATGNYVCFERGGLWRGQIQCKQGVTYTAYGEGDKPIICGSPEDGADESKWVETDIPGLWKYTREFGKDVGVVIFNHGEAVGLKCLVKTNADGSMVNQTRNVPYTGLESLTEDLEFYHIGSGALYLVSEENPGKRFNSIEFAWKADCFDGSASDVTIDNFNIKYTGAHGVGFGSCKNLTVTNCEIEWIGGGILSKNESADGTITYTRYGNGVEIYGSCDGYVVEGCYIHDIYDAGITNQLKFTDSSPEKVYNQKNIRYAGNVLENCEWTIEYYLDLNSQENPSTISNFVIEDNYLWYAGGGWCIQRPNKGAAAHIKSWMHLNRATDYSITNNIMVESRDYLIHIWSGLLNADGSESMPAFENNILAENIGGQLGYFGQNDSTKLPFDLNAEDYMDGYGVNNSFYFIEPEEAEE
ncbi:MAG: right-handed parallel beta-helix repeat-containing protein [Clostridia bacterium]|nr:right-handed parallel beta-helix repeat-containing protein [Clostridia bacterium]